MVNAMRNHSELYKKDTYRNKNFIILINNHITEYDLKSANTSLCKEYNLLPDNQIDKIEKMKKKDRVVTIGKLQRKNKKFKDQLKSSFIDIRRRFFEENLITDDDIVSIKKDAIFSTKICGCVDFGYCHFSVKNEYSSYMYLNKFEFYYSNLKQKIDVKGIDDTILEYHNNFMLDFMKKLFYHLETSEITTTVKFYKRFVDKYKRLQLPVGYYREFNQDSVIRLNDSDETYDDEIFIPYEHKTEHLNIDYNFFNILLPISTYLLNQ